MFILLKISRKLHCPVARAFALYSSILLITCTTQIIAFLVLQLALFENTIHLASISHTVFTIGLVMYSVNVSFSQALIVWRFYVVSDRNVLFSSIFAITPLAFIALNATIAWKFNSVGDFFLAVQSVRSLTISAWAASAVFQSFGAAFIIWKTYAIPVEVRYHANNKFAKLIFLMFFLIVDSGCIFPLVEIIALAFDIVQLQSSLIVTISILEQLSAFVPLTIVLRESIKADHDLRKNLVNTTSTFLMNRTPGAEPTHRGASLSGMTASAPVVVAILKSEHKRSDMEEEISMSENSAIIVQEPSSIFHVLPLPVVS